MNKVNGYQNVAPLPVEELAAGRSKPPERDYPPLANRLCIPPDHWAKMIQNNWIEIPDDPRWHITNHPNRNKPSELIDPIATAENPLSDDHIQQWEALGLRHDTAGRPLHPRAEQLLTTHGVGMFTGPGFHYRYGPQRVGNLGIRRERNGTVEYAVTLVHRSCDVWGMPGGYANTGETVQDAAFREGFEEAGIQRTLLGDLMIRELFSPPKGFRRDTLHAWAEEWFTFAASRDNPELQEVDLEVHDIAEVLEAAWMTVAAIENESNFMGTHRHMIMEHEQYLRSLRNRA